MLERPLVVLDELLPVIGLQGKEYDIRQSHLHRKIGIYLLIFVENSSMNPDLSV